MKRSKVKYQNLVTGMVILAIAASADGAVRTSKTYSWETQHARVLPSGDLEWAPKPFAFEPGSSILYIDFENGSDTASGTSKDSAWKHHPWGRNATAVAASCTGVHTYVFKRGVYYRGSLKTQESGGPDEPIRLTSDPSWGDGAAVICGSEALMGGWKRGADHRDIPSADKVWYKDLDFAPRNIWMVDRGQVTRIPLARTPNWKVVNEDDVKSQWWQWDYPNMKHFDNYTKSPSGRKLHLGVDSKHIKGDPAYFKGAIVWSEYGWVMGCPYPAFVEVVDMAKNGVGFGGQCGGVGSIKIVRHCRYFLEDKPHYLDDPGGYQHWKYVLSGADGNGCRFGHAYYLDGAFKNYHFNNIAWGKSNDRFGPLGNTAAFQEIYSYQNTFFNNTIYNFLKGTRRQAPTGDRNKYLGNIWQSISDWVFWHTPPARTAKDGNERDAGPQSEHYPLETNAYAQNIFHDITGKYASFKPSGQWHQTFDDAKRTLREVNAIEHDMGQVASSSPLSNPQRRDFRPSSGSAAIDQGVKVFVPWGLYAVVGEWNFYAAGDDPARIMDEHWYMTKYYVSRQDYHRQTMFALTGVNITKDDYLEGPLEDWTKGALRFNGRNQYAVCPNNKLDQSITYRVKYRWFKHNGRDGEQRKASGKRFKSPQIYDSNFLIEAFFKTAPNHTGGILAQKMDRAGYSLEVSDSGAVTFIVSGGVEEKKVRSTVAINDGKWHHVIAECDREAQSLTIYIDGKKDNGGPGIGSAHSLANSGDLYVGGTPRGGYFNGTVEFLRICLGTLADAGTDIEELYAWQFDGPFSRDFVGNKPNGRRDAGAIEKID